MNVSVHRLRDGATYLALSTFVPEQSLSRTLSVLRSHWRRWGQSGFDPSEVNVARWRAAGAFAAEVSNPNALAMELLDRWSAEPAAVGSVPLRPDLAGTGASRLNDLFATCRANTVLGLTGDETHIRHALDQSWPAGKSPERVSVAGGRRGGVDGLAVRASATWTRDIIAACRITASFG